MTATTAEAARAAVEKFLSENPVDPRAGQALRNAGPEVQMQAMERGSLADCKNPSAALMVRINGSQSSSSGGTTTSSGLSQNEMKGSPEEVWARIMAKNKMGGAGAPAAAPGYGAYGADPTSLLLAQQVVAQQQQQMALQLYYQQLAAQQALLAAQAQPAAGLTDPALLAAAGGSLPSSAPDPNGIMPGAAAAAPLTASTAAGLPLAGVPGAAGLPGGVPGQLPPGAPSGAIPPGLPGQLPPGFALPGAHAAEPGFAPQSKAAPFSPGAPVQQPMPAFGKAAAPGFVARPAPY